MNVQKAMQLGEIYTMWVTNKWLKTKMLHYVQCSAESKAHARVVASPPLNIFLSAVHDLFNTRWLIYHPSTVHEFFEGPGGQNTPWTVRESSRTSW
jgi:hypothetical protein